MPTNSKLIGCSIPGAKCLCWTNAEDFPFLTWYGGAQSGSIPCDKVRVFKHWLPCCRHPSFIHSFIHSFMTWEPWEQLNPSRSTPAEPQSIHSKIDCQHKC
eukprot:scaffold68805_cov19-Tisochrysis_lutea.AAC.1